jgi:hypothetical protein
LIVPGAARDPDAEVVKPTVQVVCVAPATLDDPENVTPDTEVDGGAAVTTMADPVASTGVASCEVATVKLEAGYVPTLAEMPVIVTLAAAGPVSPEQVPFKVMVTDCPDDLGAGGATQPNSALTEATPASETSKPLGNVMVMVSEAVPESDDGVSNAMVQFALVMPAW